MGNENLKFKFITACMEEDFYKPVWKGMMDASRALGVIAEVSGVNDVDNEGQIRLVREAILQHYNGIALNIVHPTAFNEVVSEAMDAGIPVVGFNVDSKDCGNRRLSCICQNFFEAGKSLAKEVCRQIKPGAKVLYTMHSEGISALEERLAGFKQGLDDLNVKWSVSITGTDPVKASEVIGAVLEADPEISTVIGTGQADTEGAALAVSKKMRRDGITVAGFDLSPEIMKYIEQGIIQATIDQQPYIQGFYPVVQLTHYCRYGLSPSNIDSGAAVINKKNACLRRGVL